MTKQKILTFRELYMPFRPDQRQLSPLFGLLWHNNEIAEKYYRFLGNNHLHGQLARILFYRTDLVEFDVSNEVNNPFSWFSTNTIANVIALMSRKNSIDDDQLYQHIIIEKDFYDTIEQQQQISLKIRQLCNSVLKLFESTKAQVVIEENEAHACTINLKEKKKLLQQIMQKAENSVVELNLKIKELRKELTDLKTRKKKLKNQNSDDESLTLTIIDNKINDLEKSLNIEQYEALHQSGLFSAWKDVQSDIEHAYKIREEVTLRAKTLVDDFAENSFKELQKEGFSPDFIIKHLPFNKFHRYLPRRVKDYINIHCMDKDILLRRLHKLCHLLTSIMQGAENIHDMFNLINTALWLKCKGDLGKLKAYIEELNVLQPELFTDEWKGDTHFPDLCYEYYNREVYNRYFPPLCITKTCRPTSDSKVSFSDCGESSLRNFINMLIKNQNSSLLDATILKKSGLNVDPRIIEFYEKNPSLESIKKQDVHSQWAKITSSLNKQNRNIKYLTPKNESYCELASGGKNMQYMLEVLLGEGNVTSICKRISSVSGINIFCDLTNFHPNRNDIEDFSNFIRLEFEGKYVFFWYFLKQHFRCATADLYNEEEHYTRQEISKLCTSLKQGHLDPNQFRALLSFHLKENPVTQVKVIFDELKASQVGDEMTFLMLCKLNSVDSMFDFCMKVLTIPQIMYTDPALESISAIIQGITPHPVIYDQRKNLIQRIRDVGVEPLVSLANKWEMDSLEKD